MLRQVIAILLLFTTVNCTFPEGPALYQLTDPVDHSEGPIWDPRTGLLYFVDIPNGDLHSYNFSSGDTASVNFGGDVSIVSPSKADPQLLVFALNRSVAAVKWDGKSDRVDGHVSILTTLAEDHPNSRLNDGKADMEGRLWYGTMGYDDVMGEGLVYLVTRDNLKAPEVKIAPVSISNGLAWNSANDKFYYVDTPTRQIVRYDYDDLEGSIGNPTVVFDLADHRDIGGNPDGMTIDSEDNLWVALYSGGSVIQVNPNNGELLQRIAIPATCVTSVMFGGPDLDVLFVTTSRVSLSEEERLQQPSAGAVFAVTNTGAKGVELFWADIVDNV